MSYSFPSLLCSIIFGANSIPPAGPLELLITYLPLILVLLLGLFFSRRMWAEEISNIKPADRPFIIVLSIALVFVAFALFSNSISLGQVLWLGVLLLVPIYFVPSYIAFKKSKKQKTAIIVLNIFLGWTFLGWVVALVWACMED